MLTLTKSANLFRFAAHEPERPAKRRLKIGLALSGGGAKTAAHVGVLSELTRAGFAFDMVAGTSAGALIGLFHCAGYDPDCITRILREEFTGSRWWRCVPFGNYCRLAWLLRCGGLKSIMQRHVPAQRFEDLATPFYVTSTDLVRAEAIVHERGDVVQAVQASMSLPGFARPLVDGERLLVDGGLLTYLPSLVLKERGADVVIGVDLSGADVWASPENVAPRALAVIGRSLDLQSRALFREQLAAADVLIRPRLTGMSCADFGHIEAMFKHGQEAGAFAVSRIRTLLRERCDLGNS